MKPRLFFIIIGISLFWYLGLSVKLYIFWSLIFGFEAFSYFTQCFYVILTDKKLIIKNGILPFWKKEYLYKNTTKMLFKWPGCLADPYIQVFTGQKKSWRYYIDLIDPKDYQEIVNILREKGIFVEVKGLDQWVK